MIQECRILVANCAGSELAPLFASTVQKAASAGFSLSNLAVPNSRALWTRALAISRC